MNTAAPIDFPAIVARVDLRALIENELGPPDRSRKWLCPFHDDRNPSLGLTPDGRRFKCWSCGASGTAIDWTMRREGVEIVEAVRRLGGLPEGRRDKRPAKPARTPAPPSATEPTPSKAPAWHDPAWQAAAEAIVRRAEVTLWGVGGRDALAWLRARGLRDETISRFRLGFMVEPTTSSPLEVLAGDDGQPRPFWCPRGVVMPWLAPGASATGTSPVPRWVGVNVRRLKGDVWEPWSEPNKCQALRGSERGHLYPWPDILPTQGRLPGLVCEGELDALLGWQEVGWIVHSGTVGGWNQPPHDTALAALARCPWWLLALDHDRAGIAGAWEWKDRAPHKTRRVLIPGGKDLGDFVQAGGNVVLWIHHELHRLGLSAGGPVNH